MTADNSWQLLIATWLGSQRAFKQRRTKWFWAGLLPVVLTLPLLTVSPLPTLLALIVWMVVALIGRYRPRRFIEAEQAALVALHRISSVEALGPLLQVYVASHSRANRAALQSVLVRLLQSQTDERHANLIASEEGLLVLLLEYGHRIPPLVVEQYHTYQRLNASPPPPDTSQDIALRRACLRAIPFVNDYRALPALVRMSVQTPDPRLQELQAEAERLLATQIQRTDFGTVMEIPRFVRRLPTVHISEVWAPAGLTWDNCLMAVLTLIQLLPQITPAQAGLLDRDAIKRLKQAPQTLDRILSCGGSLNLNLSRSNIETDFILALLEALEVVGQEEDLPFVAYHARRDAATPALQRIKARAQEVLSILEARLKEQESQQSLLRASQSPPTATDQLLRPITTSPAEPSHELLRPQNVPLASENRTEQGTKGGGKEVMRGNIDPSTQFKAATAAKTEAQRLVLRRTQDSD